MKPRLIVSRQMPTAVGARIRAEFECPFPDGVDMDSDTVLRLPLTTGRDYAADARGIERVKAILFTSEENAIALIKAFPVDGVEPRKLRRIMETPSSRQAFYTFGLTFEVE